MASVSALLLAYVLGTAPTAVLVSRLATRGEIDIRSAGTGNPGAANALKVLGAKWGLVVLLVDVAKAVVACALARRLAGATAADFAGTAAVVGHCFPVWTKFRGGGKGVACSAGQCLATFPVYFPVDLAIAALSGRSRFANRAYAASVVASIFWVGGATLWAAAHLSNAWGPRPTAVLPLSAAASSAVIIYKFAAGERASAALQSG